MVGYRGRRGHLLVVALALTLLLSMPPASAEEPCDLQCELEKKLGDDNKTEEEEDDPVAGLQEQADEGLAVADDGPGFLSKFLSSTGALIGDTAGAVGAGIASGAKAVWSGITAIVKGVGQGVTAASLAVGTGAALLGGLLVSGVTGGAGLAFDGVTGAAVGLGSATSIVAITVGKGAGAAAGGLVDAVAWTVTAIIGGIHGLLKDFAHARPSDMPPAAWAGIAAGGTAVVAGGGQAAAWYGWKRLGGLAGMAGMGLFSRIAKNDLLEHPVRAQLHDIIKENPGIHISELSRRLDVGWGTTIHHLRKLRAERLVSIREVNNQKCYFLTGAVNASEMLAVGELKHPTARQIAAFIGAQPLLTVGEISQTLGLTPSLVSFHVTKLVDAGLAEKVRDGRFVRVAPTQLATEKLLPQLAAAGMAGHVEPTAA